MRQHLLINSKVLSGNKFIPNDILIEEGKIKQVGAGLPSGRYQFPGRPEVEIRPNDAVRYVEKGGWLAGSSVSLDEAVRRSERVLGCSLAEACRMAGETVARVLNLGDRLGKIQPGFDADLTVLDPQKQPIMTIVAGEVVWQK
jgi:N-acetylglucosamine-6-phosphate deacetylase